LSGSGSVTTRGIPEVKQGVGELPDEAGARAASDHIRRADKLVDAAGFRRRRTKTLVPGAQRAALDVAERMIVEGDNEMIHIRTIEIAAHPRILFVRLNPPAHHIGWKT